MGTRCSMAMFVVALLMAAMNARKLLSPAEDAASACIRSDSSYPSFLLQNQQRPSQNLQWMLKPMHERKTEVKDQVGLFEKK